MSDLHLAGVMVLTFNSHLRSLTHYIVHDGYVQVCSNGGLLLLLYSILKINIKKMEALFNYLFFRDCEEILVGEALGAHVPFLLFLVPHRILSQSGG